MHRRISNQFTRKPKEKEGGELPPHPQYRYADGQKMDRVGQKCSFFYVKNCLRGKFFTEVERERAREKERERGGGREGGSWSKWRVGKKSS